MSKISSLIRKKWSTVFSGIYTFSPIQKTSRSADMNVTPKAIKAGDKSNFFYGLFLNLFLDYRQCQSANPVQSHKKYFLHWVLYWTYVDVTNSCSFQMITIKLKFFTSNVGTYQIAINCSQFKEKWRILSSPFFRQALIFFETFTEVNFFTLSRSALFLMVSNAVYLTNGKIGSSIGSNVSAFNFVTNVVLCFFLLF